MLDLMKFEKGSTLANPVGPSHEKGFFVKPVIHSHRPVSAMYRWAGLINKMASRCKKKKREKNECTHLQVEGFHKNGSWS